MRNLEQVLARNGAVALLCDRDLKGRGVAVEFFGERTTLPAGPVSLAIRTGAPLMPAAAYFGPDGTHRVVVRPPIELPEGVPRSEAIAEGTQLLAAELEALIRQAPEQWHLLQPNWPSDTAIAATAGEAR
jgi:phosphatidylinositol dimannoside acyltransferase